MKAAEKLCESTTVSAACESLGVPRSSFYRARQPKREPKPRPTPERALSQEEREQVRQTLNSERFQDSAPRQVYAALLDLSRVYAYLAKGQWFRQVSKVGTASLGQQIYGLGVLWSGESVEVTFDPEDKHLIFRSADGERTKRLPLKGVSIANLMGEMGSLVNLNHFQLALPFTWDEWRVIRLCETLGGTT